MNSLQNDIIEPIVTSLQPMRVLTSVRRSNLLVVIEDEPSLSRHLGAICDFLGIGIHAVSSAEDVGNVLDDCRPLAVIAPFEGQHQDSGDVLKAVAIHDPELPVMLLTERNAAYLGAVDALVEVLQLTRVQTPVGEPGMGELVDFLARACQHAPRRRMIRTEESKRSNYNGA